MKITQLPKKQDMKVSSFLIKNKKSKNIILIKL